MSFFRSRQKIGLINIGAKIGIDFWASGRNVIAPAKINFLCQKASMTTY